MEQKISLNTKEGQNSFTTKNIKGLLDAIIIQADLGSLERVSLIIQSELGYLILKEDDISTSYLAPRTRAVSMLNDYVGIQDRPNQDKFNLNERLIITIIGPKGVDVGLILRY